MFWFFIKATAHHLGQYEPSSPSSNELHGIPTYTASHFLFLKDGPTTASFLFIFGLFKQTIHFLQQINVKKCHVHPISGAGIRTHDLWNASLFPLDQGYRPMFVLHIHLVQQLLYITSI